MKSKPKFFDITVRYKHPTPIRWYIFNNRELRINIFNHTWFIMKINIGV